ncbi:MAG TPA: TetR/AcrR family transcriptional regulator [Acidimicrobiia bacterium]
MAERAKKEVVKRPTQTRRRTSVRRQELIAAAARLFASRGYYAVTVDDIGEALGLSGPALYRHFPSKEALLVAVFDQVIENQRDQIRGVLGEASDPPAALEAMVRLHVKFAVEQRENMAVWRQEFHHLPDADSWRLRRAQRLYVEEWVHVIHELRPELNDAGVRALVHGVLGLLQSPSDFQSGLADEGVINLLMSMAVAAVFQASTEPLDFPALAAKSRSAARTA